MLSINEIIVPYLKIVLLYFLIILFIKLNVGSLLKYF